MYVIIDHAVELEAAIIFVQRKHFTVQFRELLFALTIMPLSNVKLLYQ